MASPTAIVAYLILFAGVGFLFLFANLLLGRFLRPSDPHAEKLEVYECGEPAIGSSFVQFDLRFYVVALMFIVFDAEVAFLFPVATLFGKQTQLMDTRVPVVVTSRAAGPSATAAPKTAKLSPQARGLILEMGMVGPKVDADSAAAVERSIRENGRRFTWYLVGTLMSFFIVLFIAFAYEWKLGAFDWVRALARERSQPPPLKIALMEQEPALT
ncbi:MAG: NADH-quinone oxidoreductase subunit A [Planctomycetia bacterium]|nr:NADH-quinone oxidoreductase subunit A [Planctomycetia bacterium]